MDLKGKEDTRKQVPAHQGKRSPETPNCQHLDPGSLASRTGRKQFPVVKVSCISGGHLSTLMCSLDQESLERAHLKDSRGYAGDDSASSRLPNINKWPPTQIFQDSASFCLPFLQTLLLNVPTQLSFCLTPRLCFLGFSLLFFVCLFVCLFYFSPRLWGTEPWEQNEACARTILDVKESMC